MIDQILRSKGIGASEIAAIAGLDENRDAHDVWAVKTGRLKLKTADLNSRPAWGLRLQQAILQGYSEITKVKTVFVDETYRNKDREWQLTSPDGFAIGAAGQGRHLQFPSGTIVMNALFGIDAKNCGLDQSTKYGKEGDSVPDTVACQCQWSCSTFDSPWWDVAALIGGNSLRTFRIYRDAGIQADLLQIGEDFWKRYIEPDVEPPIGSTEMAAEYIRQKFPRHVTNLRLATDEEAEVLDQLRITRDRYKKAEAEKDRLSNVIKLVIGDGEGLLWGKRKVTFKKDRDSFGVDWEAVARESLTALDGARTVIDRAYSIAAWLQSGRTEETDAVHELLQSLTLQDLLSRHQVKKREGARKLMCYGFGKDGSDE